MKLNKFDTVRERRLHGLDDIPDEENAFVEIVMALQDHFDAGKRGGKSRR